MPDIDFKVDMKEFEQLIKDTQQEMATMMHKVGNVIVNYSKETFNTKRWNGVPWPNEHGVTNLLIGSGNLRRSIRIDRYDKESCLIISDTDYSEIHNNGGIIEDTNGQMQKFCWAKWYETGLDMWKYTALKLKKDGQIIIPQRQFMGDCYEQDVKIEEFLYSEIKKIGNK
jgi:phage gpG-like protein